MFGIERQENVEDDFILTLDATELEEETIRPSISIGLPNE